MALDLDKANTPDAVLAMLRDAAEQYTCDAYNLDTCGQEGRHWRYIAAHLEAAANRIERSLVRAGYPLS